MDESPRYRPLYQQVYDFLVKQISAGEWAPGESLPSEQALAGRLNVSQGTVRKALDALAADSLIDRRQGKGTYVAEHTPERALFRFFRMARPGGGGRAVPTSAGDTLKRRAARAAALSRLGLAAAAEVYEVNRIRLIDGEPAVLERIVLPAAVFPGLERHSPLPNALYALYQREYGVNIVSAQEELRADAARKEDCRRLRLAPGAPLLHIDRVALSIEGARVEWRASRCDTTQLVYSVTLS
jgi:GntR family transcriptional regulator